MSPDQLVALIVVLGLTFTFTVGFQDGSTIAASAIAARSMHTRHAIALIATFEFLGAIFGGSAVAHTIRSITSWPSRTDLLGVLASCLCAATTWNFLARRYGIPSSSTHALVGGLIGAVIAGSHGFDMLVWTPAGTESGTAGISKVVVSLFISPLIGFGTAFCVFLTLAFLLRRASSKHNKTLSYLQWLAVPALAFGHGTNSTQKSIGVMMLALHAGGRTSVGEIPDWLRISTAFAIACGVLALAPRIVRRVGAIYKQRPIHGLAAESSAAFVAIAGSLLGWTLCVTQVVTSSVVGVGAADRFKRVDWGITKVTLKAWLCTIPGSAIFAALFQIFIFEHLIEHMSKHVVR